MGIQQWVTPFGSCFGIFLIVAYGATWPIGRFILVLVPGLMDLKHMVFESPEDLVAARRERNKRKDMLRKEVGRLRKSVDKEAADRLREEAVERIASKGSRRSDPESEPQKK